VAASTTPPSQSLNRRLLFGLPLLAAAFAYANAVLNGFVLDDYHIILENPDVLGDLNFFAVTDRMSGTYYRPISVFTFWLDHRIFGFWAGGFHLTSVLYHGAVTLLAVQLCRRLFSDQVALFAGLIFAVHPVHTEAVTAIANRTEILATGFCLLALLVHLRPGKDGALRIAGENALLLLGLLSKESALTLPLMIFAVDWLKPGGRLRVTGPLRVVPAIALYFWIKTAAIGIAGFEAEHGYFYGATLGERIFSVMAVMWRYVGVLLWPTNLSASYEQAFLSAPSLSAVLGAASVVAVAVAILSTQRSGTPVALGLALMAAAMAPYLHLQSMMIVMADRFMYLPSVGFCMVAGYGLERLLSRLPRRALRIAVPLVLVATLSLLTAARNLDWRDPVSLWTATVERSPTSAFAHGNLGLSAFHTGDVDLAIGALQRALELAPGHIAYTDALAAIFHHLELHGEELRVFEAAARAGQTDPHILDSIDRVTRELTSP